MKPTLSIYIQPGNENHHLWNNNGTWYIAYTIHPTPATAKRIRRSLKTKDLEEARRLRDEIFRELLAEVTDSAEGN